MTTLLRSSMMLLAILFAGSISAADIIVTDDGSGTGTTTWTNDNTYFLDGFVFVNSGQVLTIEAGTVIKGIAGTGADASALVVARGGQIFANGTADAPIVFTFEEDPLDGSIPFDTRGQWGGVIVLGAAELNSEPGETQIEGIPETEERGLYGGSNNTDNSGVIQYISIRHGGTDIGAGNEINGLTLGGVGSGTVIEHVEVISNADDGIEFFGGTANIKWASVAFCGDDSFDYDEGWRGYGQYWFCVHDVEGGEGDRGGEHDGGTNPEDGMPFGTPVVYNATYIGRGIDAGKRAITMRDNAGGQYHNSVFANWGRGIDIENLASGEDSYERFLDGSLAFAGNVFQDVVMDGDLCSGQDATASDLFKISMGSGWASESDSTNALNASTEAFVASFEGNNNQVADLGLEYEVIPNSEGLNPVPVTNFGGGTPATLDWFDAVSFKGAFNPDQENWLFGWTMLDQYGFLSSADNDDCDQTIVVSDDGSGTGTTTWKACNTYVLDGFVFVNDGQCLTIEPGTVIKGMAGTGADASALVVARGGKIFAEGTPNNPVIFTFEADPLDGSVPYDTRGQWGGLIVLGNAELNSEPGETQIEGIPETEERGLYGGTDNEDNSGVIRYISVRHGGSDIGAGNEINGITLGGVGSATTIDYVEVVSNADDGIEFFGGTARVKHAAVAFCGDDSFDYDEGWRGQGQFWFTVHDDTDGEGDRGGEHDGGTNPEDGAPYATPMIYNATYMGRGMDAGKRALTFRDNAGGQYHNSIFYNWGRGVDIENLPSGQDSYQRFQDGELVIANSCFYDVVSADATAEDIFKISMGSGWASESDSTEALNASTAAFQASFASNGNEVADPQLNYEIEEGSEMLMVKPEGNVDADPAEGDWYTAAAYKGAFDPSEECTWLHGWSFLDERMFLGCVTSIEEETVFATAEALSVFPNPNTGIFNVRFNNNVDIATLSVMDMTGRTVAALPLQNLPAGAQVEVNLDQFGSGLYLVQFEQNGMVKTARVIVR
ncbi:T9SS type A sorting domain-containing protein [Sanyastnella coralliicola]|uniref:T9SS type A sorting domain-containing protein n=1 Tax=Sanyastnella coralliicola TaxID=3069118 RepID=UPI0027B965E5|nr:T9SS type A sorting domain-containing protein [Longitalea sp. SCSIO 12813]